MANSNEYMKAYMANRRKSRREKLIGLCGGKCNDCGSTNDLQFDHIDPWEKSFVLSGPGLDKSWNRILEELQKCTLRCDSCHRNKTRELSESMSGHNKILEPMHGTMHMYTTYVCRCNDCQYAKHLYRNNRALYNEIVVAPENYVARRGKPINLL